MTQTISSSTAELAETLLKLSTLGMVITDAQRRVLWVDEHFSQWLEMDREKITGQALSTLPLEVAEDASGEYTLFSGDDSNSKRLFSWQVPYPDIEGAHIIYFRPISTEELSERKRAQLLKRSALPSRPNWMQFLDYEVSRSRRYQNPLTVIKLSLVLFNQSEQVSEEDIHHALGELLRDQLRWADMVGCSDSGDFLLVLPETSADSAAALRDKLATAVKDMMKQQYREADYHVAFGVASWEKGDDGAKMLARARQELKQELQRKLQELDNS